jgi:hypothetical protein
LLNLPTLASLHLSGISLSGTIPAQFWNQMPLLADVDLSLSGLSGTIPGANRPHYFPFAFILVSFSKVEGIDGAVSVLSRCRASQLCCSF